MAMIIKVDNLTPEQLLALVTDDFNGGRAAFKKVIRYLGKKLEVVDGSSGY